MRRVRSRLTILLLILVIVTSLFSLTFGALVRNGIIFQQRDNIRYLVFGYAAKDILLLLIAVAAVAVLITVTSRSTTNPIRELSRAAREIAGGNYDVTVPERDRVEEFGELERNFNLMTAELRSNEYLRKDFISSVSHQLKTPLSILNGYAQLLAEGGLSDTEEREYSQYIAQESDRLVGLIDDMLRLSRIDHREIQRKAEIFPLGEQLRRAVLQLAPRWTEAGLSVSADICRIIRQERKTALLVTHDIAEAVSMSDRVIVLSRRPAVVKAERDMGALRGLPPLERRDTPEFHRYFNAIWKELDVHA